VSDDSGRRELTFVTRRGCQICEEALPGVRSWTERLGLGLVVLDVDLSLDLLEAYDHRVPVVVAADGEVLLEGRWNPLREARMMFRARYG